MITLAKLQSAFEVRVQGLYKERKAGKITPEKYARELWLMSQFLDGFVRAMRGEENDKISRKKDGIKHELV